MNHELERFQRLRTKYQRQCDILGIYSLQDIRGEFIKKPAYELSDQKMDETDARYCTLQIFSTSQVLLDDFEYLEMFDGFTVLILGDYRFFDPMEKRHIGGNLHRSAPHLKWLVINYHILSLHADFLQLAPFLEVLRINGTMNIPGMHANFPLLRKLSIGFERLPRFHRTFQLVDSAPQLTDLRMVRLTFSRLFENLTRLYLVNCKLDQIPLSDWVSLKHLDICVTNNCSGLPPFSSYIPQLTTLTWLEQTNMNPGFGGTTDVFVSFTGQTLLVTSSLHKLTTLLLYEADVENLILDGAGTVNFTLEKVYATNPNVHHRPNFTNLSIQNNTLMTDGFMAIDLVEVEISGELFPWALLSMRRLELYTGGTKINMNEYQPIYEQEIDGIRYNMVWSLVPCSDTIPETGIPQRLDLFRQLERGNPNLRFITHPDANVVEEEYDLSNLSEEEKRVYSFKRKHSIARYNTAPENETCSICLNDFEPSGAQGEVSRVFIAYCFLNGLSEPLIDAMSASRRWNEQEVSYARSLLLEETSKPHCNLCVACNITPEDVLQQNASLRNNPSAVQSEIHLHDTHYFHPSCLSQWVYENKTCPMARTRFSYSE